MKVKAPYGESIAEAHILVTFNHTHFPGVSTRRGTDQLFGVSIAFSLTRFDNHALKLSKVFSKAIMECVERITIFLLSLLSVRVRLITYNIIILLVEGLKIIC